MLIGSKQTIQLQLFLYNHPMARIKYATGVTPLWNGRSGLTFMPNASGQTLKTNAKARHFQSATQMTYSSFLLYITRLWQHLDPAAKQAWQDFVNYLPQGSMHDPTVPISAYANFVKRNYYKYLSEGYAFVPMLYPILVAYEIDPVTITSEITESKVFITTTFERNWGDLLVSFFCVSTGIPSINNPRSLTRFVLTIPNATGTWDITNAYLAAFGILPPAGSTLLFRIVEYGHDQGQFFYPEPVKANPPVFADIHFGILYHRSIMADARQLAPAGWHIPSETEFRTLRTYASGSSVAGGKLKEPGTVYWQTPNTGATNEFGFNLRGNGFRSGLDGSFQSLYTLAFLLTTTYQTPPSISLIEAFYNSTLLFIGQNANYSGFGCRLICDSATDPGFMRGNDLKLYHTIKIGSQVWLADNLTETKFRTGESIPEVTDNSAWSLLTTSALCAYNNDWSLV